MKEAESNQHYNCFLNAFYVLPLFFVLLYSLSCQSMNLGINKKSSMYGQTFKVSKGAKIRNRYNQVPHLTQDTNGKVKNSQLYTTNESQEAIPFPAGDHKAHINRRKKA